MTPKLYVIEEHDQLLHLWREQNLRDLHIVHFDFHCDMRGMLVDRSRQRAYHIFDLLTVFDIGDDLDIGNFLTHAVMENRVTGIKWIHRIPGGRGFDVGTVKYTSDPTIQLLWGWLKLFRKRGIPLAYDHLLPGQWQGFAANEFLDIDWDYFAGLDYPPETIAAAVEEFFALEFPHSPSGISVCFSHGFSHPDRTLFEAFITRLANKFGAEVVRIPLPPGYGREKSFAPEWLPTSAQSFINRAYRKGLRIYDRIYDRITRKMHRHNFH